MRRGGTKLAHSEQLQTVLLGSAASLVAEQVPASRHRTEGEGGGRVWHQRCTTARGMTAGQALQSRVRAAPEGRGAV